MEKVYLCRRLKPIYYISMIKRTLFCLLALLAFSGAISAGTPKDTNKGKQRTFRLWGHVKDGFTKVGIPDVKITLMRADSTVIDTCTVNCNWSDTWNKDYWFYFDRPAVPSRFIIKATHPDYEPCFVNYDVKHVGRNTYFDAPWHFMKRRTKRDSLDATLDEVVVKGSRVKLTYKGDTLVFDASAFKLPEGSMLDALIRQLPGVKLDDNGVITVNGRKVDFLTLNGKDFFKGDNKVMLENLPYYTVSDIKVHEKKTEKSEYMGRNIEQPDYVMDVNLKREYRKNYIANAEAGGATEGRYLGRGFGSRITDHSNVSAYVNFNNINESRTPSGSGDWSPSNAPVGRQTTKTAGMNMEIDDKDKRYKETLSARYNHTTDRSTHSSRMTRFLPDGNTYSLNDNSTLNKRHSFSLNNTFILKKPFWFRSTTEVSAGGYDQNSRERSSSLSAETSRYGEASAALDTLFLPDMPAELRRSLTNRMLTLAYNTQDNFSVYQRLELNKKLPWGDNIEFEVNGQYNEYNTEYNSDTRLDYFNSTTPADYRNVFQDSPSKNYRWEARGEYYLNFLSGWTWRLYSLFNQENNDDTNDRYRLERLDGWQNGLHPLGTLPEDEALLRQVWSEYDSNHKNRMTRTSQSGLHFYYDKRTDSTSTWLRFHLPLYVRSEKLAFRQGVVDTCVNRNRTFLDGNINMNLWRDHWKHNVSANFNHRAILPDLYNNIDLRDDRDPLSVTLGNPNLKTEHLWSLNGRYYYQAKSRMLSLWTYLGGEYRTNPVLQGYGYNRRTGAYTYQKQNGDYLWSYNISAGVRLNFDKAQRWSLDQQCGYGRGRGQMFQLSDGAEQAQLYGIGSYSITSYTNLRYNKGTFNTGINCYTTYVKSRYYTPTPTENGNTYLQLNYNIQYTIPVLELQVSTQFGYYHNNSSVEGMPPQDNTVWNIYLSRALLKDKSVVLKLCAFDIFDNVSHYQYEGTADYFNIHKMDRLNRYVMMSVAWSFKAKPKKS